MKEVFKIGACIVGVLSLYIGVASLLQNQGGVFLYILPINIAFVWWYSRIQLLHAKKEI